MRVRVRPGQPLTRRAAVLACTMIVLLARAAGAQDDPDGQVWVQALALGEVAGQWRTHLEVQPRFMSGASELGLTLVRTALGRPVGRRASVWAGHAWVPRTLGPGVRHEQRVWQQLLLSLAGGAWSPSLRLRLEQRWLDSWDGASHRARVLARVQRPLDGARRWSFYAYDETMITLDRTARGPSRGFDRNRLSSGVSRRLAPALSTDVGYLWEHAVAADGRRNDHVFIAVVNVSAPR